MDLQRCDFSTLTAQKYHGSEKMTVVSFRITKPEEMHLTRSQSFPAPVPELESLPIELIEMILNSTRADGEPILSESDICSLCIMNRMLQAASFDTFAKRLFTMRKHMLDQRSLATLSDIAMHPVFSVYVCEVAISPERINDSFIKDKSTEFDFENSRSSDGSVYNGCNPLSVAHFRELVTNQNHFNGGDYEYCFPGHSVVLGQTLQKFPICKRFALVPTLIWRTSNIDQERGGHHVLKSWR